MNLQSEAVELDPGIERCTNEFFESVIEDHQTPLLRYALRLVRSEEAAQDIVQEVFLRFFKSPPKETHPKQVSTWLYRVAHNLCIDHIRRESRMREQERHLEMPEPVPLPSAGLAQEETRRALDRLLAKLSEKQRTTLLLKVQDGKSYREISEITGMSVSNVGFQIHYSLKRLAGFMKESEG